MIGSSSVMPALLSASRNASSGAQVERVLRRVHVVVLAEVQLELQVHERERVLVPLLRRLAEAVLDARDVLLRDRPLA